MTGPVDHVSDGERNAAIANGAGQFEYMGRADGAAGTYGHRIEACEAKAAMSA